MRIARLSMFRVNLPLKKRIDHASATRDSSENIVVRCELVDGTTGWGEGVPREYVTGETPRGAFEQLEQTPLQSQLDADCGDWSHVIALCDRFRPATIKDDPRGCYGNALKCAVELSMLDAYGRLFGKPVSTVLDHLPELAPIRVHSDWVQYSGAIATAKLRKARWSALAMRAYGFAHCKVKVGISGVDDAARLHIVRRWVGGKMNIRVDANEAWNSTNVVERIESLQSCNISAVEQPVSHEEVDSLTEARKKVAVPIMLDESLTGLFDAEQAIQSCTCDLFNVRLSKCGGMIASARLMALAHCSGLGYQLGCHPGESGILSAAGRQIASSIAKIQFLEGSYDRHLVKESLIREDITFRFGGWAPAMNKPGLGVEINQATVNRISMQRAEYLLQN